MTVKKYCPSGGKCWQCQIPHTVATYDDEVFGDSLQFPIHSLG